MIRSIGIVLIIWGLIAQPLMAVVPASMVDDNSQSSTAPDANAVANTVPNVIGHHDGHDVEERSKAPCHGNDTDDASTETCDNCDKDCMNGACVSSCVINGAPAFHHSSIDLDLLSSPPITAPFGARAYGLPSRIFHPPKLS